MKPYNSNNSKILKKNTRHNTNKQATIKNQTKTNKEDKTE